MEAQILDPERVRVAIIGAGPIGLEAALYARFLGYDVAVWERAANPYDSSASCSAQPMHQPFGELVTPLGLAAIRAQSPEVALPHAGDVISWADYQQRYLRALAQTDLVADCLQLDRRVTEIRHATAEDFAAFQALADHGDQGEPSTAEPLWSVPVPDDAEREWTERPWCVESLGSLPGPTSGWFDWVIDASGIASGGHDQPPDFSWYGNLTLALDPVTWAVPLLAACGLAADRRVAWPDAAERMPGGGGGALGLGEPGLLLLGSKTYGRTGQFLLSDGHHQIRDLFAWLGGRRQLDLYRTISG
jgi:hypothetical protein